MIGNSIRSCECGTSLSNMNLQIYLEYLSANTFLYGECVHVGDDGWSLKTSVKFSH